MTEIEIHGGDSAALSVQMDYARAVSSAALLPQAYRGKPADIMLAVGLGQAMGLSPAESLYRIDVIQGKPTASAELIAANVRKAGHKLRVRGDESSATATIIRADDPDFEFTVTRDTAWAQAMGLTGKDNYKKQPGTMLQWRAITAVARLACPEALYGVAYTADEMTDLGATPAPSAGSGADRIRARTTAEQVAPEVIPEAEAEPEAPDGITAAQLKKLGATMRDAGITERGQALAYVGDVIGREVESRNELTKDEAAKVIDALEADLREQS